MLNCQQHHGVGKYVPQKVAIATRVLHVLLSCKQVSIDNESYDDRTVITVDSANRPGTLVEVVQCLTELGLNVKRARISSDGGWFVDEFHVTETAGPMQQVCTQQRAAAQAIN